MPALGRYYEAAAEAGNDDGEDDYMSNDLLAEIAQAESKKSRTGPKSYVQLRKDAQRRKEEKGYIKPRAEREREAREEGLKRNLMTAGNGNGQSQSFESTGANDDSTPPPPSNKALSMMMKMGFKPGEALGRQASSTSEASTSRLSESDTTGNGPAQKKKTAFVTENEEDDEDENGPLAGLGSARGGLGSKKRPPPAALTEDFISLAEFDQEEEADAQQADTSEKARPKHAHRVDPIEIQMRSGRSGLGVEEAKRRKLAEASSKERVSENVDDYRSRAKLNHSERRAEGQLKSVRKTCLELDERAHVKSNHMWLDPLEEYHKERESALGARSRFRIKERDGLGGEHDDDNEYGDDQFTSRLSGKRDNLNEEVVLSSDEEDVDEEELERREQAKIAFLRMSAMDRLAGTLEYMREKYHYCYWCGTAYDSKEDLAESCPGEDEDDH